MVSHGADVAAAAAAGRITQVIGPVVDVAFPAGKLPSLLNALTVTNPNISDANEHLGESIGRTIAMDTTEGLVRGGMARDTGSPISMPVGPATLGRILNVVGQPVDNGGPVNTTRHLPIHRPAPAFVE